MINVDKIFSEDSDLRQLELIKDLVKRLQLWQTPYEENSIEEYFYNKCGDMLKIIKEMENENVKYGNNW